MPDSELRHFLSTKSLQFSRWSKDGVISEVALYVFSDSWDSLGHYLSWPEIPASVETSQTNIQAQGRVSVRMTTKQIFFFSLLSILCICILSVNSFPCHQYICTVFTRLHVYKASGTIWFIQDKPITWSVKFHLCKTPKQLPKKQRPPSLKWKIFSVLLKHQKYYFPEKSHDSTGINGASK